jgi:hypothetical protein
MKVTAADTAAPTTTARRRVVPAAVAAATMARATTTSLWPARKGTHRTASTAGPATPAQSTAADRHHADRVDPVDSPAVTFRV